MNEQEFRQKLDYFNLEIERLMRERYSVMLQAQSVMESVHLRRRLNADLIDTLNRQGRELALMAGENIAPQMHFGDAVVVGFGTL